MSPKSKRVTASKSKCKKTVSKRGGGLLDFDWLSSSKTNADGTLPDSTAPTQEKKGSILSGFTIPKFNFFGSNTSTEEAAKAAEEKAEAAKAAEEKAEKAKVAAEEAKAKAEKAAEEAAKAKMEAEKAKTEEAKAKAKDFKKGDDMAANSNVVIAGQETAALMTTGGKKRSKKSHTSRKHRKTNKNAAK